MFTELRELRSNEAIRHHVGGKRPFDPNIMNMGETMIQKVYEYIEENRMLQDGQTVVVGVSGGADSVCLLTILTEYAKAHPLTLIAAHVHHGLRKNADGDEEYVRTLCESLHVPLKVLHIDAAKEAGKLGVSIEEAGRMKRYEFFREISAPFGASGRIAVAHHRDDLCETVLFQLFRGSGVHGLRGILPVSGNIIRPLLCVSKEEICSYLEARNISWREDESNEETVYARNRIRHEILPIAEQICPGALKHIEEAASKMKDVEEFIAAEAAGEKKNLALCDSESGQIRIGNKITELPAVLRREILLGCLQDVCHKKRDIGTAQVEALEELFASQVGKERDFIYGIHAKRTYEGVTLAPSSEYDPGFEADLDEEYRISLSEEGPEIDTSDGMRFTYSVKDRGNDEIPTGEEKKWFDEEELRNCVSFPYLVLRHPKRDDYLIINRDGGMQKVYDFFKNAKVPEEMRDKLWVLASGRQVLWIVGYRMGEFGKVKEGTKKVLEIAIVKEE